MKSKPQDTSWENSHQWYDSIVGEKGHYYHESIILPKSLQLLALSKSPSPSLLDLGCGQGILARHLPPKTAYLGVDASASLLATAKKYDKQKEHSYLHHDLTHPLQLKRTFTHAACILALQNMSDPLAAIKNAHSHLENKGKLLLVLNHPCFRIPRQSSWQIDVPKKLQYRRIDRYASSLAIPIRTHPGMESSQETISYHLPLSAYSSFLKQAGFVIEEIEEWCSEKKSYGKQASMENRARAEFPLFLAIHAIKMS